jgi:hypothetical protein
MLRVVAVVAGLASASGSIAGLSFAYCDFTHYQGAAQAGRGEHPLSLTAGR